MSLMIFVPGATGVDEAELKRIGCADLLEPGFTPLRTPCAKGPGGKAGVLVTFEPGNAPRSYEADSQTWLEAPPDGDLPKGRYWVGYANDRKPSPEDLQRRELIDGGPVILADNKIWIVPCCEYAPKRLTRDPDTGNEKRVVTDAHKHWVDWTNALYQTFVSEDFHQLVEKDRIVRIPNGLAYAALCLSKNYRVNMDVIDLLGLVGEYQAFDIARTATGLALIEQLLLQKKSSESLQPAISSM